MNDQSSLYIFQQLVSRLLYMKLFFQSPYFVFFIWFSGIVTGFSPCIVSVLPMLFTYLGLYNGKRINILSFLLGLLSTELIVVCIVSVIGYRYYSWSITFPLLSSILYIGLGLIILQIFNININPMKANIRLSSVGNIKIKNFLFGGLCTINTLPCTIPIVLTIFNILLASNNYVVILLYSIVYLFGYIFPILLFFFIIQRFKDIQAFKLSVISSVYTLLGGSFMLSSGVFKLLKIIFYIY